MKKICRHPDSSRILSVSIAEDTELFLSLSCVYVDFVRQHSHQGIMIRSAGLSVCATPYQMMPVMHSSVACQLKRGIIRGDLTILRLCK